MSEGCLEKNTELLIDLYITIILYSIIFKNILSLSSKNHITVYRPTAMSRIYFPK